MKFRILFSEKAYQQIQNEVKAHPIEETGGVLVGFRTPVSLVVTHVSGPGPGAIHLPFSIQFDEDYCLEKVKQFQRQGKYLRYIGDWHSHPFSKLKPSKVDQHSFSLKSLTHYHTTFPLMVITGPEPFVPLQSFLLANGIRRVNSELVDQSTLTELKKKAILS